VVEIEADRQQRRGELYLLEGRVRIRYRGMRLEADEVIYDERNRTVEARNHVAFEREQDRLEAEEARYHLQLGSGIFSRVRGTSSQPARPSRQYLTSERPLYFEGERVERLSDSSYVVHNGWVTNCDPGSPKWRLRAAQAKIRPDQDAVLHRATFRILGVAVFYAPLAWISLREEPRQTGFLLPTFGNDSRRGTNFGGGFFWAINPHADLTVGAHFFNQGGWTQNAHLRAFPTASSELGVTYFGAIARTFSEVEEDGGPVGVDQTGQFATFYFASRLTHGFRAVVDAAYLSSFSFRLGFADTYNEAVTSEVHGSAFLSNNTKTLYFNGFFQRYQDFLTAEPETSITLASFPGVEFGTRPLALNWLFHQPLYFSFDSSASGMRRDEPRYQTPDLVQRYSLHPQITVPFRLGSLFRLTPTMGVWAMRYGSRLVNDPSAPSGLQVVNQPLHRFTQQFSLDIGLPAFARIFEGKQHRYKHVFEPSVTYRYVNGVENFDEILRFDETDILTDTHEIEYSLMNRLYRKEPGSGQVQEIASWRLSQKYYFDPTLRGSVTPGVRNVVTTFAAVTPFAFADGPRRFSPIVSALTITPGGRFDSEFRLDYDTTKNRLVNTRLLAGIQLTRLLRTSVQHFVTRNDPVLQPQSNQVVLTVSYGTLYRRGTNAAFSLNWNVRDNFFQYSIVQVSHNWDCCGVAFEYRRFGLGPLRSENEYRFAFTIANLGTFGTIRTQERLF
jgi:LPS-assembly protein